MRRWLAMLSLALLIGACANGDTGTDATGEPTTAPPAETAATADATVRVASTSLGDVLVDSEGMTLYLFTRDTATTSACTAGCLQQWPPLTVEGEPVAGDRIDEAKLATITRDDGSKQVSYAGHPLYRFTPDEKAGDVKGHGVNDVWFAVTPEGDAVEKPAS